MKHILISGGAGAVGQAIAKRFAADGYTVSLIDRESPDSGANVLSSLSGNGHHFYACDLRNAEDVQKIVAKAIKTSGNPDVCVHSAVEPILREFLVGMDTHAFRAQFDVGLFGGFTVLTETAKHMKEAKAGYLIGITSSVADTNTHSARMGAYTCAKFALRGLLRELAHELAPYNIRVHAVAPGLMQTPLNADLPDRIYDVAEASNPLHTRVTPDDVAKAVSYLCSENASALTGLSIPVTGGGDMTL
jgi:NAD(P)-dependent dehydrogenase (short-subunit alcohol dehydrogenase family)